MENDNNQQGCLIIGEGVTLSGNFTVPHSASIAGTVDGTLSAKEVFVGATGIIKGNLTADTIDVRGELHQDVIANKFLFIRSTGKVAGNIQYSEIEIEKGASLEGNLNKIGN